MPGDAATITPGPSPGGAHKRRVAKYGLRGVALGYLAALLIVPVVLIFFKAFDHDCRCGRSGGTCRP